MTARSRRSSRADEAGTSAPVRICVFGAGSIGCYLGGRLALAGAEVAFVGRERIGAALRAHGLRLSDLHGSAGQLAPAQIAFASTAEDAAAADLVLVTVKAGATAAAGAALAPWLRPGTPVIGWQNGLHGIDSLRAALSRATVLPGIVEFNVLERGDGRFHQGSDGRLDVPDDAALAPFADVFARAGLPLARHADFAPVQWAKLQLNLNNAINALSDLPLREELGQRSFRRCLALAQRELLAALDAARIAPARLTPVPPHWMPRLLELPDALFHRLARRTLAIDPLARSSTWEDLQAGRPTEVDVLNGEVVALARAHGLAAPVNARLQALVHAAERGDATRWRGEALLAELRAAA